MAKAKKKSRWLLVASVVLLLAAIILVYQLVIMQQGASPSPSPQSGEEMVDTDGFPEVDWEYWQSINPDIIGWITVPGTPIDYPIVQAQANDPTYYLHHDIYGNYNVYGVPYLDADCAADGLLHNKNAIVFGHHMNDGSMFAAFADYSDYAFATEHATILVQTPTEKATLQTKLISVQNGSSGKRTEFVDDADYQAWYANQVASASVVLDDQTEAYPRLVTFVTCSYLHQNDRTLVLAS